MSRYVVGRARYAEPPEVGTLLGPKDITREHLVVIDHEGDHALIGYATTAEIEAAMQRIADGAAPRSVAEHRLAAAGRRQA